MSKKILPNATAVLVLGICSIVFGCLLIGLAAGIVGIVVSGKSRKLYNEDPNQWEGYGSLNAGYIMSIIGTCLAGLTILYMILVGGSLFSIFHHL